MASIFITLIGLQVDKITKSYVKVGLVCSLNMSFRPSSAVTLQDGSVKQTTFELSLLQFGNINRSNRIINYEVTGSIHYKKLLFL